MSRKYKQRKKKPGRLRREVRAMRPERRRRSDRNRRFIRVDEDTDAVFHAAIASGVLSADAHERLYAGRFHYMFHDEDGTAWFRRCDAAEWVEMSEGLCAAGERP